MDALFTGITEVITNMLNLFSTISTTLMSNSLFQLTIGIVMLMIIIGLVFYFVKKVKRH